MYIDSELEEEYESDFEYTVESSTTCIISPEDEDIEYKCKIDGTKFIFYHDGELVYTLKKNFSYIFLSQGKIAKKSQRNSLLANS